METRGKGARRADGTRGDPPVLPAGLSRVNLNAAGIDVGAESHFVAVPEDRSASTATRGIWRSTRSRSSSPTRR